MKILGKTNTVLLNLQDILEQKKPFVFYRKPNSTEVNQVIQKDNTLYFLDDFSQQGIVISPFDNSKKILFFPIEHASFSKQEFTITSVLNSDTIFNNKKASNSKETHIELVKKGIDYIKNKQTPKIVLSRKETLQTNNLNLIKTFENLLNKYTCAFVYIWFHPKVGLWLGATPETLIKTKNNNFKTMSLAGTQIHNNSIDVVWQEKEIQEHQFVTDYIVSELSKMGINSSTTKTNTIKAGNLLHLHAEITGRLKNKSQIGNLIKSLHPTPAVCGLPKEKAKDFIINNENYNREFYTGFLGELNFEIDKRQKKNNRRNIENHAYNYKETQTSLFVNLRCMQIKKDYINIYVGGGITKDSNPEKEYLETVAKAEVMKSIINLSST